MLDSSLRHVTLAAALALTVAAVAQDGGGPVRMARVVAATNDVDWRPSEGSSWSAAVPNLPLRQGGQVWVPDGGHAELQFDDGSVLRLGGGAVATLQTLFSDDGGEFTEIKVNSGLAYLRARNKQSEYQIDTPDASIKAYGPARLRLATDDGLRVVVRDGEARVEGEGGQTTLRGGDELDLHSPNDPYRPSRARSADAWDGYNSNRDVVYDRPVHYVPRDIALVSPDLDSYGTWHDDPQYGHVWAPRHASADWRPYRDGRWTWVEPFGWTWVGDEPWGWAPYHYGTWVSEPYGWGWVPGPAQQYWSPAVVHFTETSDDVAWCPLAPAEVRYPPTLSIGFRGGDWTALFSIGGAACYYPANARYCEPRPWRNVEVNRVVNVYNVTQITNVYNAPSYRNVYVQNNRFVPRYAAQGGGATFARRQDFGGGARFQALPSARAAIFRQGRSFSGAPKGGEPLAGPFGVHPVAASFAPRHAFVAAPHIRPAILNRPVYRAALRPEVAHFSPAFARALPMRVATKRPLPATRPPLPAAHRPVVVSPPQDKYSRFANHAAVDHGRPRPPSPTMRPPHPSVPTTAPPRSAPAAHPSSHLAPTPSHGASRPPAIHTQGPAHTPSPQVRHTPPVPVPRAAPGRHDVTRHPAPPAVRAPQHVAHPAPPPARRPERPAPHPVVRHDPPPRPAPARHEERRPNPPVAVRHEAPHPAPPPHHDAPHPAPPHALPSSPRPPKHRDDHPHGP